MYIQLGRDFLNLLVIWLPGAFSRISLTGPFQEDIEHWEFEIAQTFLVVESYTSKTSIHFTYRENLVCMHKNTHQFDKKILLLGNNALYEELQASSPTNSHSFNPEDSSLP